MSKNMADDANEEIVGMIRILAKEITGGNCTFADDDLQILAVLARERVSQVNFPALSGNMVANIIKTNSRQTSGNTK